MKLSQTKIMKVAMLLLVFAVIICISTSVLASEENIEIIEIDPNATNNTSTENTTNTMNITDNNTTTNDTNNSSLYNINNTTDLPKTGIDYTIVLIIALFIVSAVYSYKKISDHKLG